MKKKKKNLNRTIFFEYFVINYSKFDFELPTELIVSIGQLYQT